MRNQYDITATKVLRPHCELTTNSMPTDCIALVKSLRRQCEVFAKYLRIHFDCIAKSWRMHCELIANSLRTQSIYARAHSEIVANSLRTQLIYVRAHAVSFSHLPRRNGRSPLDPPRQLVARMACEITMNRRCIAPPYPPPSPAPRSAHSQTLACPKVL